MKTCENEDCKFYHKDLIKEGLLDTEFENTGEEVEVCKWCGRLAYYKKEEYVFRERTCIVCHKKFLQRMKRNKQGKAVRIKGESDRFCSVKCKEEFCRSYLHDLRAGNEQYKERNRKRMEAQRYEQYKERAKPLYDELKSLILNEEDDAALKLLTDISLGRVPLKKVK